MTSSLVKAHVELRCTGKSAFDAIESLCGDVFLTDALGLAASSSPPLRLVRIAICHNRQFHKGRISL